MEAQRGARLESSGEAGDRYRRLIEQSHIGLFQTDVDGRLLWVNSAAAAIVGYDSPDEFMDAIDDIRRIYVNPERRDDFQRAVEEDGSVAGFEYEIFRQDGSRRWLSVSASAMRGDDGSVEGYEGSVIDVTPRKLLESAVRAISSRLEPTEAVAEFAEVMRHAVPFHQLTLAVVEGDHYRRLVSISSSDRKLPVGERVPLAGNSTEVVVREERPVVVQDTTAGDFDYDRRLHEAGVGSYATVPLLDESGVFATFNVGMAEKDFFTPDVIALLTNHAAAVAHAVKNIIVYEQQASVVERLRELDQLKSEFFASISHDLRNPVAVLLGISGILKEQWGNLADDKRREMINAISNSAEVLQRMTERDLQVALMESGELIYDIGEFDLAAAVGDTVESFRQAVTDRTFELAVDGEMPLVRGDKHRHVQILQNLVSNAVKFSEADTTVSVSVIRSDNELVVCVADEGSGIDDEHMRRLFERLSRGAGPQPGHGLGLYIAKSMVEAQGGRIWAESEVGKGSRFFYTAPTAAPK